MAQTVGWFGQLHLAACARQLKDAVLVAELYLDRLYALPLHKPAMRELSRFSQCGVIFPSRCQRRRVGLRWTARWLP